MPPKFNNPNNYNAAIGRNLVNQRSKAGVSGSTNATGNLPSNITCHVCRKSKPLDQYAKRQVQRFQDTIHNPYAPGGRSKKDPKVTCRDCTPQQTTELQCCICEKVKGLSFFANNQRRNPTEARCIACLSNVLDVEPDDPHFVDERNFHDDDHSNDDNDSEDSEEEDFDAASDDEYEKPKPIRNSVPGYVRSGAENRAAAKTDKWGRPRKESHPVSKQENFDSFDSFDDDDDDEHDIRSTSRPGEDTWEEVSAAGRARGRGAPPSHHIAPGSYTNVSNSRELSKSVYGVGPTHLASSSSSVAPTTTATTTTGRGSGRKWAKPVKVAPAKYSSTEIKESDAWDTYARGFTNQRDSVKQTNPTKKKKKPTPVVDDEEDWD